MSALAYEDPEEPILRTLNASEQEIRDQFEDITKGLGL